MVPQKEVWSKIVLADTVNRMIPHQIQVISNPDLILRTPIKRFLPRQQIIRSHPQVHTTLNVDDQIHQERIEIEKKTVEDVEHRIANNILQEALVEHAEKIAPQSFYVYDKLTRISE